jgi:hypothetical protein
MKFEQASYLATRHKHDGEIASCTLAKMINSSKFVEHRRRRFDARQVEI